MNSRIFVSGLSGGVLAAAALAVPLYFALPGQYVASWEAAHPLLGGIGWGVKPGDPSGGSSMFSHHRVWRRSHSARRHQIAGTKIQRSGTTWHLTRFKPAPHASRKLSPGPRMGHAIAQTLSAFPGRRVDALSRVSRMLRTARCHAPCGWIMSTNTAATTRTTAVTSEVTSRHKVWTTQTRITITPTHRKRSPNRNTQRTARRGNQQTEAGRQ